MLTLGIVSAALLAAAPTKPNPCHHAEGQACAPAPKQEDGPLVLRGEKLGKGKSLSVAELLEAPTRHEGKSVVVEGQVRKACERKGCWMELAGTAADKGPGVRVTFKDYGFFVPLDSAGAKAKVKGLVKVAELSEATAKHYEEEGALVPRGADGKPREVQLVATGVELVR